MSWLFSRALVEEFSEVGFLAGEPSAPLRVMPTAHNFWRRGKTIDASSLSLWSDVRSFEGKPWRGIVDVVSGGFPCQDISPAGKGAGIEGERSSLWGQMARIIDEVRPRFALVENSAALTSRGLGTVLGDLASIGMDARWGVFRASDVGFDHQRARLWIVASDPQRSEWRQEQHDGTGGRMGRQQQPFAWDRHWLDVFTRVRGTGHGVAHRLDRTDAIRNGQVPRVVATAWRALMTTPSPTDKRKP